MTHDSRTFVEARYRRTLFIAALFMIGVCLFASIVWLSICVPLAIEDESSLLEGLYHLP